MLYRKSFCFNFEHKCIFIFIAEKDGQKNNNAENIKR